jgi:phosphatidylglycerol---prolipoprotein diacylglyceryl transferase
MQPNPVLLKIGPVSIYWYGVLIVTGAMLAAQIASRLSRRNGHDPEIAWNMLLVLLLCGVLGGRIYHLISSWDYYRLHPSEMFGLQMAGFGIYGSVIGGTLGLWVYTLRAKLRFLEWADYVAPGLILAQAIGRWGNFFNQELYGYPTNLPWGVFISPEHRLPEFAAYQRFHPTFLYESVLCFLGFLVLWYLARNWQKNRLYGELFFLYGVIYAVIRFFTEFQRPDAWKLGGIPTAQWISVATVVLMGAMIFARRKLRRPGMLYTPGTPWVAPPAASEQEPEAAASEEEVETMAKDQEEATPPQDSAVPPESDDRK